ncbi:hypothetical protein RND71_032178 [Anisodus tanguticus]|uniref:Uncharacterized protein n=1 Tax=Anisodus tanguticus TaxID=243964 RepID=A0AAE1RD79_9SOLA|nr:hypothetical protein RND71_032178 [Anisodus tanguticus]
MIEHMVKDVNAREGSHGLPYGFFLTTILEHFKVKRGKDTSCTRKHMIFMATLEECECVPKKVQLTEKEQEHGSTGVVEVANAENAKLKAENEKLRQ